MAKNTIADLDTTSANNTDILGQSTAGSALANTIDTIVQNMLAVEARAYADSGGVVTVGGSADAITITSASTYQLLETGLFISFKAAAANTTAATLNLDGLGVRAIRKPGDVALSAGEIAANGRYIVIYDAAYNAAAGAWVIINPEKQTLDADLTAVAATGLDAFSGLLYGLTLSNGTDATNDINIAAGIAIDGTNAKFMKLGSAITKQLDAAWAVGTNQGGLDTGAIANTTYHMWLIMRSDTGVVDVLFSASATSPTMPANYDYKRRIGSIVRTGAAIKAFVQNGDTFMWGTPVADASATNPGSAAVTRTLTVPTGIQVYAIVGHTLIDTGSGVTQTAILTSLAQADVAPTLSMWDVLTVSVGSVDIVNTVEREILTNTSGQIRSRMSGSAASNEEDIFTFGWRDSRGRLG